METQEILKIKSDLINEIRGQVAARGYYNIDGNVRFLYTYRGGNYPYESCNMTCDQETSLIDMKGVYSRCVVTKLYFVAGVCELMVECGTAFDYAKNISIDDLANIRDLVCSMTDEHFKACKEYMESEELFDFDSLSEHDNGVYADLEM